VFVAVLVVVRGLSAVQVEEEEEEEEVDGDGSDTHKKGEEAPFGSSAGSFAYKSQISGATGMWRH
jgi:hypothetical protein